MTKDIQECDGCGDQFPKDTMVTINGITFCEDCAFKDENCK